MPVSKKTGKFHINPQMQRHLEEDGKTSIAKEIHKSRSKIGKLFADSSEDSLLGMIPKIDLSKK